MHSSSHDDCKMQKDSKLKFILNPMICLGILTTLDTLVYSLAVPYFPQIFHGGLSDVSWLHVQAASNFMGVLAGFTSGWMSDSMGRKSILLTLQSLGFICALFMAVGAWTTDVHASRVIFLAGAFIFRKLNRSFSIISAIATDISDSELERGRDLATLSSIFGVGFALGPAIGGMLAYYFDEPAIFAISSLFSLTNVLLIYFRLGESHDVSSSSVSFGKIFSVIDLDLFTLIAMHALVCIGQACYIASIGMAARDVFHMDTRSFGVLVSFFGISYSFSLRFIVRYLQTWVSSRLLLSGGLLLTALARSYVSICTDIPTLYLAHMIISIGTSSASSVTTVMFSNYGKDYDIAGSIMGFADSVQRMSGVFAPLLLSIVPHLDGYYSGALASGFAYFSAFVVSWLLNLKVRHEKTA